MTGEIEAILARSEVFRALSATTLGEVVSRAQRRVVRAGEYVFREGDPGDFVFVLESGVLEVSKVTDTGVSVPLRELHPGQVGGLTSMSVQKTRSASLRAMEEAQLIILQKPAFLALLQEHLDLTQAVMLHMSEKVRSKNRALAHLLADSRQDHRHQVVFFDAKPYDRRVFDRLVSGELAVHYVTARVDQRTARVAQGARIVCTFVNDELSAPVLEVLAAGGVELVALRCAGFNQVDLKAAARLGISVVRVPAYSPHAVAEHAVALLLALNRKTHRAYNRVREGNFSLVGLVGIDLYGRTAGIVGMGKIGAALARILDGFGMRLLAYDPFPPAPGAGRPERIQFTTLEQLLKEADVVSLHAPLTPETHHLMNRERIGIMKPGAILLNTSRGGLVDANALIQALKTGQVGAAGLDVYEEESEYFFEDRSDEVITDDLLARLMTFKNVLITSHQGFLTEEALLNIARTTLDNIAEFLAGRRGSELTHGVLPS